jgi:transposase
MGRPATKIELDQGQRTELEGLWRQPKSERRYSERARIILLAADGKSNLEIARALGTRPATVSKWRVRFQREGLEGLHDDYRPGRPPSSGDVRDFRRRLLACLDKAPPKGYARWNGRLLGEALGVKPDKVWQELRTLGINLQRRRSWCVSTDPEFAAKSADIIGLYLGPPGNAVVLSLDEKPCIQALEREQGWLKMPDGRSLTGFAHEYKRHGTTNLFAALEVATGRVAANCFPRKRRDEFLRFLDTLLAQYPNQQLHLILDNLSIHKLRPDHPWRKKHPNVHFHFTPTHASWLNQIEIWFSILSRSALKHASFRSARELVSAIQAFVETYNENAQPFQWTKVRVRQKTPASKYADLIN